MSLIDEVSGKIRKYCAYQERTTEEVKFKLKSFKLSPSQIDDIIIELINEDFIDEERYVRNFIRSKITHNLWGKIKIRSELLRKGIPENMISLFLAEVEENRYADTLNNAIEKWLKSNRLNKETYPKLYRYLLSKGFESQIIIEKIRQYQNRNTV